MIKVTHIISSVGLGGVQNNLIDKAQYDKKYSIKRKVLCIIRDNGELEKQFRNSNIEILNCLITPSDKNYRPYRIFKIIRKLSSILFMFKLFYIFKKDDSKIIHSEDSSRLFSQFIAAYLTKKKFIWQLHTNCEVIKSNIYKNIFYKLVKFGKITLLVDSNASIKSNIYKIYEKKLFHLVSPGINISKFSQNKNRLKFNVQKGDIVFGSVGRLHPTKGFDILIKSFSKLVNDKGEKYKLFIAGDGPLKVSLKNLIEELGLSRNIILLGEVNNIEQFLSSLNYYIQSSLNEGFPLATIEALASRIPIISTDSGGLSELIEDSKNGIMVNRNSITALYGGILKILSIPCEEIDIMIQNGFHTASEFSTKAALDKDILFYKSLINSNFL
tara:strand:+ start:10106 stop:11263 length:1158 start_codon:yes stop_codon:yes gene_type:complete